MSEHTHSDVFREGIPPRLGLFFRLRVLVQGTYVSKTSIYLFRIVRRPTINERRREPYR